MKGKGLVLSVVAWIVLESGVSWAYPSVDAIRYPLDNYVVGSNHLGAYNLVDNHKWHLGEDVNAVVGSRVYAIGNGIVKQAQIHNGYGGMYIIEHNVGGEKVCALYVHMNFFTFTKKVGDEVGKGAYLGKVGNSIQNGGWPVHFHFGIRKGEYPENPNAYIYGDWIFSGYTSNKSVLDDWYGPFSFIAAHQRPIAQWPNGNMHQPILDCFNQFSSLVGTPFNNGGGEYVHDWYGQDGSTYVIVQDFYNESSGQYYAIIDNPRLNEAFLLKGGFRWYCTNEVDGPAYFGPPTTNESLMQYYPVVDGQFDYNATTTVSYIAQEFEHHKMLLWRPGDLIRCVDLDGTGGGEIVDEVDNPIVGITLLPSDGQTLQLNVYALSATSVQINGSWITDATRYVVYEDGVIVGYLNSSTLALTLTGRTSNSTHQYQLIAYDAGGIELVRSAAVPLTLPVEQGVGTMTLSVSADTTSVQMSWNAVPGTIIYAVLFDGVERVRTTNLFATIYNIPSDGTHTVTVQAIDASGTMLAEGQQTVTLRQNWSIRPVTASASIAPGETAQVVYEFVNDTGSSVFNFRNQRVIAEPSNCITIVSVQYIHPPVVAPYSTAPYCIVTIVAGAEQPLAANVSVSVYCEFDGTLNNVLLGSRSSTCAIPVVPFYNVLPVADAITYQPDVTAWTSLTIGVEARDNAPVPASRVDGYLDNELVLSLMVPALTARATWPTTINLPPLTAGTHDFVLIADADDVLDESDEADNELHCQIVVGPEAQAALDAIAAAEAEAERIANEPLPPCAMVVDDVTDVFLPFDGLVGTDQKLGNSADMSFPLIEYGLPLSVLGVDGTADGAYRFTGSQCLIGTKNAWLPTDGWTMEGWFRTTKLPDQYLWQILHGMYGDDVGMAVYMSWDIPGLRIYYSDGVNSSELYGVTDIRDGTWHYVALTCDATWTRLYIDGVLDAEKKMTWKDFRESYPLIGAYGKQGQPQSHFFEGDLDTIRFSPVARSAKEIAATYAGSSVVDASVVTAESDATGIAQTLPLLPAMVQGDHLLTRWTLDGPDAAAFLANVQGNPAFTLIALNGPTMTTGVIGDATTAALLQRSLGQGFSFGDDVWEPTGAYSIVVWLNSTCTSGMYILQSYAESGNDYNGICVYTDGGTGKLRWFHGYGGGAYSELFGTTSVCDGRWHLCVLSFDGSVQRMYIDNQMVSSRNAAVPAWASRAYGRIGYYAPDGADWGMHFDGSLDDIQLYDVALTADDVNILYTSAIHP